MKLTKILTQRRLTQRHGDTETRRFLYFLSVSLYLCVSVLNACAEAQTINHPLKLAESYATTGRYNEAITEFEKLGQSTDTAVKLRANLRRAEVLKLVGKDESANSLFTSIVDYYENEEPDSPELLTIVAQALTHLEKYHEANSLFIAAIEADDADGKKDYLEVYLKAGELYTSKYNYAEAAKFFDDALKINPDDARLHLAIANNSRIDGGDKMNAALSNALRINPSYVDAMIFAASVDIEADKFTSAQTNIDSALKINPNSLDAHAMRAAMLWIQNRQSEFDNEVKTIFAINPKYGSAFETISKLAIQKRRYEEANGFLRKAIALSPNLWSAHLSLGMGFLRTGLMDEGRSEIEAAFEGDPFNIWAKNTLDLLDVMKEYKEEKRDDFILRMSPKDHSVLASYAADLLIEAKRSLSAKYKFTPKGPIFVEIFPNHEDFAVRTLGLPGLGALGVCFGKVIAQDSPSARPVGSFNWGSTLWHEYTHVITLQTTNHLIPRWFSEGLSVYEEHNARPGWGDDWSPEIIKAFQNDRLFGIASLDNGFIHPKRPDDIQLAYFQAYQICSFITERYGFDAILQMLTGYRNGKNTTDILRQSIKLSEADFDREFKNYINSKIDKITLAAEKPDEYDRLKKLVQSKIDAGDKAAAVEVLKLSFFINPFDHSTHTRAGNLLLDLNKNDDAAREFRVALATSPPNIADAHYNIARALAAAGKTIEAKRAVLRSLEAAPSFDKAQELLLKLTNQ